VRLYRKALLSTEQQQSKALTSTSGHSSALSKEEQVTTAIICYALHSATCLQAHCCQMYCHQCSVSEH
jgi:hypothetical protein